MSEPAPGLEPAGAPTRGVLTLIVLALVDLLLLPGRLVLASLLARWRRARTARLILGASGGSTPPPLPSLPCGVESDATHDPARG